MPTWISLAWLVLAASAAAAQPAPAIELELIDAHPPAGAVVRPFTPVYGRIRYQTDLPVRVILRPFRHGEPVIDGAYYSGSPHYPPPSGEALAWFSFSEPQSIDEIRAIATDNIGNELARTRLEYSLSWREGAASPAPAEWVAPLQERAEALTSRQQQPEDSSLLAILLMQLVFALVPISVVLQIVALKVLEGPPRGWAWISAFAMAGLWLFVLVTALAGSNLSPIWLVFLSPLFVVFLGGLLVHRWLTRRRTDTD